MSAPLPSALRMRFQSLIEEGLSVRSAAAESGDSKVEGDGSTPSGAFNLHHAYFRPDRVGAAHFAIKCVPIRNWQIWCDDPRRADYNKLLDRRSGCEFSHERLARADKLYDLFVVVGYNWPNPVPNRGAAIFIHAWRSPRHPDCRMRCFRCVRS